MNGDQAAGCIGAQRPCIRNFGATPSPFPGGALHALSMLFLPHHSLLGLLEEDRSTLNMTPDPEEETAHHANQTVC